MVLVVFTYKRQNKKRNEFRNHVGIMLKPLAFEFSLVSCALHGHRCCSEPRAYNRCHASQVYPVLQGYWARVQALAPILWVGHSPLAGGARFQAPVFIAGSSTAAIRVAACGGHRGLSFRTGDVFFGTGVQSPLLLHVVQLRVQAGRTAGAAPSPGVAVAGGSYSCGTARRWGRRSSTRTSRLPSGLQRYMALILSPRRRPCTPCRLTTGRRVR